MNCPKCGAPASPGRKFCDQCGSALAQPCPSCGFANDSAAKFCGECGAQLSGAPRASTAGSPRPPVAPVFGQTSSEVSDEVVELKFVSILFADLVGFTTISESRDPEEVRELLSRYFELCRERVERYGGTVEKFIGDAVMAVWGAPTAQEDDAERAVRAALDLIEAVGAMGDEVGASAMTARAGVLSGTAAVNVGVTGQAMVAGDLVNTASRIQALSEPGTVLVGETTKRASEAAIAYLEAGSHQLKGKTEPVRVYRALRVVAGRGGLLKSERLEAPFVGRERELKLVKDVFHASTEDRRAHLVQVTGIAGIGKSRLAWEFFKYMDGLKSIYFWHRGRCLAYGQGVTYFALAEMIRGRAGILEAEDHDSALAKLLAMVEQYVPDPEERRFVTPRLAHLVGLEERTAPDKQDLFAAWRLFLERMADRGPVLMAFEDMQWADPSLLEFLSYLMEWSRSYPLFVMSQVRPDSPAAALAASMRNATLIHLEPLPPAAMDKLLTGLAPGLPGPLVERIRDRAEGIPLYAVETVRMLLDRGLLIEDGAAYRPTGEIDTLEIPETLHAVIAARLDGMSAEERQLTQDAAVLGKTFTSQALASLVGLSPDELQPMLNSLSAKEVLAVQSDPRSPERGQYGFLQDMVRTVAYETLSKRERRVKHLAVASYFEQTFGVESEEIVEVVASHYLEAWQLDPDAPDAPEIRSKARTMLVRAAERAASLAAGEEAETAFQRAAALSESDQERAALTERAGEMAELRGRPDDAGVLYEKASQLFQAEGQSRTAGRVQARLAGVEWLRGQDEQAVERIRGVYAALDRSRPDPDVARVASQLGRLLALQGHFEEATPLLEEALEIAEHQQLTEVYCQALSSKAILFTHTDRLGEARALLKEASEVALEHGLTAAAMRAQNNLGVVLESQDRALELIALTAQQLELARRAGDRFWELNGLTGMFTARFMLGQWETAFQEAAEAEAAEELATLETAAVSILDLCVFHVARGEVREAEGLLEKYAWAEKSQRWEARFIYGFAKAGLELAKGRPGEALAVAEACLAQREELGLGLTDAQLKRIVVLAVEAALGLGDLARAEALLGIIREAQPGQVSPWLRAQSARLSARLSAAAGRDDEVEPSLTAAEAGLRECQAIFDLAVTLTEHAEWLVRRGRQDRAAPLRAEAGEIFGELRARPWLERLGALAGEESVPA